MLAGDSITLLEPHSVSYATFLASQIGDLIAYFDARRHRGAGEVTIDETHDENDVTINWGTPGNESTHSTPKHPPQGSDKPRSGVLGITNCIDVELLICFLL
jgi:hypothetical protein